MIDDYHRKILEIKKDSALFVSKETVNSFFRKKYQELPIDSLAVGDNISFFDINGNIFYQITCIKKVNNNFIVKCLNLKNQEYYTTKFELDKILALNGKEITSIKIFRDY